MAASPSYSASSEAETESATFFTHASMATLTSAF